MNITEDIRLAAAGSLEDWYSFNKHFMPSLEKEKELSAVVKNHKNYSIVYLESKDNQEKE